MDGRNFSCGEFVCRIGEDSVAVCYKSKVEHFRGIQTDAALYIPGLQIAPNTGANATKFFTLATKS